MSRAAHTPGEWQWSEKNGGALLAGAEVVLGVELIEVEIGRRVITSVSGGRADLALIAAAPDLLEALKALVDPEAHDSAHDPVFEGEPSAHAISRARAAIAKATGGQP